jgi:hypothetical protein
MVRSNKRRARKRPLSLVQFFRLGDWVRERADRLTNDRPTFEQVARDASADLGFAVAARDVGNACQATQVRWTPDLPPPARDATASAATRRTRDMQIGAIATAVRELYREQGKPLPPHFDDYLSEPIPHEPAHPRGRAA